MFLLYLSSYLKTFHLLLGQLPMKPFRVLQEVFLPLVYISDDKVLQFFFPSFHVNKENNVKNEFQRFCCCSSKISVNYVGNIQSHLTTGYIFNLWNLAVAFQMTRTLLGLSITI